MHIAYSFGTSRLAHLVATVMADKT